MPDRIPSLPRRGLWCLAMTALAIAPLQAPGRAHCSHATTGGIAAASGAHDHAVADADPKDSPADAECPHCPVEQCRTQVVCSVQLAEATGLTDVRGAAPETFGPVTAVAVAEIARGSSPPTPPPQPGA